MVPDSYAGLSSAVWLSLDSWDCCVRFSCPVKASARLGLLESLKRSSALWPLSFFKEKFWKDRQAWNYSFWASCLMITMHGVETDRCDDNQQKRDFLFQERHEFASCTSSQLVLALDFHWMTESRRPSRINAEVCQWLWQQRLPCTRTECQSFPFDPLPSCFPRHPH